MATEMICGIDPGAKGAVAFYSLGGEIEVFALSGQRDLHNLVSHKCPQEIWVEAVGPNPIFGARGNFGFGRHLGQIEGVLASLLITYRAVSPKDWQALAFKGIEKALKPKEKSLEACRRIFPRGDWTKAKDGHTDAALIAWYGAQQR